LLFLIVQYFYEMIMIMITFMIIIFGEMIVIILGIFFEMIMIF